MKCPICDNVIGFHFGTCVNCGYNHIDHEYKYIKVDTEILRELVPPKVFEFLVNEHEKTKLRK